MNIDYYEEKVAVILGFYNGNDYIDEQVKSILEQTLKILISLFLMITHRKIFNLKI